MFSFYGKSFHGAHFAEPTVFLNNLFPEVDPCPILLKLELICTFTEVLFIPETMQRSSCSPVISMVSYFNHFGNCVPLRFVYDFGARHGGHFTLLLFIPSYKFSFTLSIRIFLILSSPKIFFRGFFEKNFFLGIFSSRKKNPRKKIFGDLKIK